VGRHARNQRESLAFDALLSDANSVLATSVPTRREVEADDGAWYIRSILPYRSDATHVEGVVVTFCRYFRDQGRSG